MVQLISCEPATGDEVWRSEIGDAAVEVAEARAAQPAWVALPQRTRTELLRRFANVVRAEAIRFATLIARETGKPMWDATAEVDGLIEQVELAIAAQIERAPANRLEGELGATAAVRHKPHGVLAVITPFTMPAMLPAGHIIAALLAGNAVVFKPSEKAAASGALLASLLHRAGIAEGVVRLLIGGPEQGRALAEEPGIDGLLFSGSAATGAALHRAFGGMPERLLVLELGGNNPLVVWDAPDVQATARIAVQSAYLGAGQRCTNARRLIVQDGRHGPLLTSIGRLIDRLIVGAPLDEPAPFLGPMVDRDAADRAVAQYHALVAAGGQVLRPLARPIPGRPFLSPALIDVTDIADRPDEELLGPVLQVIRVKSFEAAIAEANATRCGVAAALISRDPHLYDRFWREVRAGLINWNRPTTAIPAAAPLGGVGLSGNHRPGGLYAADRSASPIASIEAETPRLDLAHGLRAE